MTALLNPTLHEEGPTPGSAKFWSLRSFCQRQRIAAFGPAPESAVEHFERWTTLETSFGEGALVLALFDALPEGVEDFEERWGPGPYLSELPEAQLEPALFAAAPVEDMSSGWVTGPFLASWSDVSSTSASFSGLAQESFESWLPPGVPSFLAALFDAGSAGVETFAGTWAAMKTL